MPFPDDRAGHIFYRRPVVQNKFQYLARLQFGQLHLCIDHVHGAAYPLTVSGNIRFYFFCHGIFRYLRSFYACSRISMGSSATLPLRMENALTDGLVSAKETMT